MSLRIFSLVLILTSLVWAAASYHQKIPVDLNHDGTQEIVGLRVYTLEGVKLGQLVVLNQQGQQLWTAPKVKTPWDESPWAFLGEFDLGDISFLDDYNQDGKVDLVATCQKSDVRPTCFKLFHWDGKAFVFDRQAMLVAQPQKPATFAWTAYDPAATRWIDGIKKVAPGRYQAQLAEIPKPSETVSMRYHPGEGFILLP